MLDDLISRDPILQEAIAAEPILRTLLVIASRWEWQGEQRRARQYERCKRFAARLVGWDARLPQLATPEHYQSMIVAIDRCLPARPAVEEHAA